MSQVEVVQEVIEIRVSNPVAVNVDMASVVVQSGLNATYSHNQTTPSSLWVVNHNLGGRPIVSVTNAGGAVVTASILHTSANVLQVSFNTPQTGTARCLL